MAECSPKVPSNYYQEINPNYNFPTEILLDQADTIDQNLKRRKRNVLVSDNNPDAKALDTPILSSQDSNEPSTNNDFKPLDTEIQDGKVVSKLFTDTVNSKTIKFHRTIFTRSKAHSHAYINWVGNGSPVIFILSVKKNLISAKNEIVEESHLYRSDNYGISWVQVLKSNENGFPENSKIFKYMPSPHDDKTLVFLDNGSKFIKTTNAGVSFETTALDDKLDDIKFHPTETQWLLGYSKSRKQIYYTTNLGSTWTRITDPQIHQVTDHKWNWGEKNIDDSKTIHFEIRIGDPEKVRPKFYPYTCYMEDCFNAKKIHPQQLNNLKVGSINRNSMLVEGGYIMVEKPLGRYGASNDLFISSMTQQADGSSARGEYSAALFTSHENFVDFHVVSAENDYIILGILQLDKRTADLFVSNTNGNTFWLVLPKVDMQAPDPNSGNEFSVDCLSFGKLAGVILCNQQRATKISYNSGANWQEIDVKNNVKICNDPNKTKLNELITENPDKRLRFQLANQHTKKGWYMPKFKLINDGKYGYAYAQGKFGLDFAMNPFDTDLAVYITRDGGVNWECMLEGRNILEMTHYGKQVLTKLTKRFEANTSLRYSADFGKSFHDVTFTDQKIMVDGILTEPGSHTAHFTIFGHQPAGISSDDSSSDSWHIITVDASEVVNNQQTCTSDDYRNWKFTTPDGNKESLGMVRTFKHQIEGNACINNDSILNKDNSMTIVENDNCYMNDYTCGYLYKLVKDERRGEFRCDFDKETHWLERGEFSWF